MFYQVKEKGPIWKELEAMFEGLAVLAGLIFFPTGLKIGIAALNKFSKCMTSEAS